MRRTRAPGLAMTSLHAPVVKTRRPPIDLALIDCLQQWFGLSDPGSDETSSETDFYKDFVAISSTGALSTEPASCALAICF